MQNCINITYHTQSSHRQQNYHYLLTPRKHNFSPRNSIFSNPLKITINKPSCALYIPLTPQEAARKTISFTTQFPSYRAFSPSTCKHPRFKRSLIRSIHSVHTLKSTLNTVERGLNEGTTKREIV